MNTDTQPNTRVQQTFLAVATPPLAQWVDGFLVAKRAAGAVAGTVKKVYARCLAHFVTYCAARNVSQLEAIDAGLIREYLLDLEAAGHNPGGCNQFYRVLKTFLRWYEVEAEPPGWRNPIKKVAAPKIPEQILEPVELVTVSQLIAVCDSGRNAVRDRAIFLALLDTGARASELTGFDVADLDAVTGALTIRHGKGNKSRAVFLGQKARKAVRTWLKERGDRPGALFPAEGGKRLTYFALRAIVARRAADAGLESPPPLHSFRRAFAINMLREGTNLLTLQRLLGHANLSVLHRYAKQNTEDLRAAVERASPADRL
jgi:integrase/recombinase XerC